MGILEESRAKAEAFAGKGYEYCKYGRYAAALDLFRQASELDPTNFKYWYNAAVACDRIGDHVGMERASQKTIECDGTFVKGYVRLAKALVRQAKYDGAAEIVSTGLLIDEKDAELQALKKEVTQKQEEISVAEARKLADRMRQQREQEKNALAENSLRNSQSSASGASGTAGSVTTVMGGNITQHGNSNTNTNTNTNNTAKRTGGGIPAHHREIPKLNNPQFADSGVVLRSPPQPPRNSVTSALSSSQPRELPRLNNPHFGDSSSNHASPRPPRLAQPYSRPLVPPNRDNGPDFKDQCGTFIVAAVAVTEMAQGTTTEQAVVPGHRQGKAAVATTNKQPPAPAPKQRPYGYFGIGGRRNNNNNHHQEQDNGGRNLEF